MAKPTQLQPKPPTPAHASYISWRVTLSGDEFEVDGVTQAEALTLFGKWVEQRGGGLTPDQLKDLSERVDRTVSRLESLDKENEPKETT
jgi:hypothetical protein